MTIAKLLGLASISLAACATHRNDPCDLAKPGEACRWAGTGDRGLNGEAPNADRLDSQLYFPIDMTFGPDGRAYIDDFNNHMIRRVEKDNTLRIVLGTNYEGDSDPEMMERLPECNPVGATGTVVAMNHPTDVKFGPDGNLWIAAWHNNKIRVLDPNTLMEHTYAGNFYGYSGDGGPACMATFNQPKSIAWGPDGSMYTIDQRNVRIRKIAPDGTITTVAGNGSCVFQSPTNTYPGCITGDVGDGGPIANATFGLDKSDTPRPSGAMAFVGNTMYFADSGNHRIRRLNFDTGVIDCFGGKSATAGYSGDGGLANDAQFNWPQDLEIGPDNNLYIADRGNNVIRMIDLNTNIVTTVVGDGTVCDTSQQACPDRAVASAMQLNQPQGIEFDAQGNLYVVDSYNNRVLKVIR